MTTQAPTTSPEPEPELERALRLGLVDPDCRFCQEIFLPGLRQGLELWRIFAPRHHPSPTCASGGRTHCTCDRCF